MGRVFQGPRMQRRAAAIYAVVFVLIGTASYTLIATAERPHVSFEDPDYELAQGDRFQVDGRTYNVSSISASSSDGGEVTRSGELTWVNQSARHTETWENESNVTLRGSQYVVRIPNRSDPSRFALVESINRTSVLQNDSRADDQTVTRNGTEYVVLTEDGTSRLVPADQYFPQPNRTQVREGAQFQYGGNTTTVENVSTESVTVAWTAPKTNTVSLSNAGNVTLGNQDKQFLVYFPDNSTVVLESDYSVYEEETGEIDQYTTHRNGLWGVTVLSGATSILLIGIAYLPSRY